MVPEKPSILIVEDDKEACEVMCNAVRRRFASCTTYCADNGRSGLELYKTHKPTLVLTDIHMPDMDGIEMAGAIRKIDPEARFIVITAFNNPAYLDRFREIGFCRYLHKPLEFGKLFSAIEGCLSDPP